MAWGDWFCGGTIYPEVQERLKNVQHIAANRTSFADILGNGSVVTWGHFQTVGCRMFWSFIPSCIDRKLHAVAGMPQCAACQTKFRQWKGLRDQLFSGACPAPDRLRDLKDEDTRSTHPDVAQLHQLRQEIAALPWHQLGELARREPASLLKHRCLACNFWTPDHTKVKSHFRQAHPQDWRRLHARSIRLCQGYPLNLPRIIPVPFVRWKYMTADCIRNNVSSCIRCLCSGSEIKLSKTHLNHNNLSQNPKQLLGGDSLLSAQIPASSNELMRRSGLLA